MIPLVDLDLGGIVSLGDLMAAVLVLDFGLALAAAVMLFSERETV